MEMRIAFYRIYTDIIIREDLKMYKQLAPYYEEFFPLQRDLALEFITSWPPSTLLDVGCGTGLFLSFLKEHGWDVQGLEYTPEMVKICTSRGLAVRQGGFDALSPLEGTWDHISCLGNTLPHVSNWQQVEKFFHDAREKLNPGGVLHLQWIHFEKLKQNHPQGFSFPLLGGENLSFKRHYRWADEETLDFETSLSKEGFEIEESVPLLFLTEEKLKKILLQTGFESLQWDIGQTAILLHCSIGKERSNLL